MKRPQPRRSRLRIAELKARGPAPTKLMNVKIPIDLADAIAEIVQLGATDHAAAAHFDLGDLGGVQRKLPLHTLAGDDAADGKHFSRPRAVAGNAETAVLLRVHTAVEECLLLEHGERSAVAGQRRDVLAGGDDLAGAIREPDGDRRAARDPMAAKIRLQKENVFAAVHGP